MMACAARASKPATGKLEARGFQLKGAVADSAMVILCS
jgi:hypothetical protein